MSDIRPIETRYAGCRFRSRLEARWAVFFDYLGIRWTYESQGFKLPDRRLYLPDFFLTESQIYVEVKGDLGKLDISLLEAFVLHGERELIIVGPLPEPPGPKHSWSWVKLEAVPEEQGGPPTMVWSQSTAFTPSGPTRTDTSGADPYECGSVAEILVPEIGMYTQSLEEDAAYRAARSARFEHGECG